MMLQKSSGMLCVGVPQSQVGKAMEGLLSPFSNKNKRMKPLKDLRSYLCIVTRLEGKTPPNRGSAGEKGCGSQRKM